MSNRRFGLIAGWGAAVAVGLLVALVAAGGTATAQAPLSSQDQQFLQKIHQGNMAEIAAGRLAESKSPSPQVQSIGGVLVADHSRLDAAGQQLASMKGVMLPKSPDAAAQQMQSELENASAGEFDGMFIAGQLKAHSEAMQLVMTEQQAGSSEDVRKAAAEAAPVIQHHIDLLHAAARELGVPISINTGSAGLAAAPSPGWLVTMLAVVGLLVAGAGVLGLRRRTSR